MIGLYLGTDQSYDNKHQDLLWRESESEESIKRPLYAF